MLLSPLKQSLSPLAFAAAVAAGGTSYKATILADSPVAYWRMDEMSGPTLVDVTGSGYNGTYHPSETFDESGAIAGDSDTAILFDGSTGYATTSVVITGAVSIEFWINLPSSSYSYNYAIGETGGFKGVRFPSGTEPSLCDGSLDIQASTGIGSGVWAHIVATLDGTAGKLYINGSLAASHASTVTGFSNAGSGGVALAGTGGGTFLCNCELDEVAIYNYALTSTQVAAHYTAGI